MSKLMGIAVLSAMLIALTLIGCSGDRGGDVLSLDLGVETTWQQVFDTFTSQEQSCIRDSIDSNTLDALLTESFVETEDSTTLTEEQGVQLFSCLNEETASDLFVASIVAGAEAEGTEVGEAEITCMQGLLQDVNIVGLMAAEDDSAEAEELFNLFLGVLACVEDGTASSQGTADDDHGDSIDDATSIETGVPISGVIGEEDTDFFRFTAVGGQYYRFDVDLGTLTNVALELLNSEGESVARNHGDIWETPPSHLIASTRSEGVYYTRVGGWASGTPSSGMGSYTLNVSRHEVAGDRTDTPDGDIPIAVGSTTEGAIDMEGDVDYFRLTVEEKGQYQIFVSIGTLDVLWVKRKENDSGLWTHSDIYAGSTDDGPDCGTPHTTCPDLEPGDHFFLIGSYGSTGTYSLNVERMDALTPAANRRVYEAFRDHAWTRPSEGSFHTR